MLLFAVGLLGVGVVGLTKVGMQFLPNTDEGFFSIRVQTDDGYSLEATERVVAAIEHELKKSMRLKRTSVSSVRRKNSRFAGRRKATSLKYM